MSFTTPITPKDINSSATYIIIPQLPFFEKRGKGREFVRIGEDIPLATLRAIVFLLCSLTGEQPPRTDPLNQQNLRKLQDLGFNTDQSKLSDDEALDELLRTGKYFQSRSYKNWQDYLAFAPDDALDYSDIDLLDAHRLGVTVGNTCWSEECDFLLDSNGHRKFDRKTRRPLLSSGRLIKTVTFEVYDPQAKKSRSFGTIEEAVDSRIIRDWLQSKKNPRNSKVGTSLPIRLFKSFQSQTGYDAKLHDSVQESTARRTQLRKMIIENVGTEEQLEAQAIIGWLLRPLKKERHQRVKNLYGNCSNRWAALHKALARQHGSPFSLHSDGTMSCRQAKVKTAKSTPARRTTPREQTPAPAANGFAALAQSSDSESETDSEASDAEVPAAPTSPEPPMEIPEVPTQSKSRRQRAKKMSLKTFLDAPAALA
jgi:hypothetical protein